MRHIGILLLLTLAWMHPGGAAAADQSSCTLKMVNTVPLTLESNGAYVSVPVIINGTKQTFLLDTGGALTQISASAAKQLNLPIGESRIKMLDMYGQAAMGAVHVDSFMLGRLQARQATLAVMTTTLEGAPYVGILAADYMGEYDIEMDFRGGKMNYFSRDHCEGKVVYWPAAAIAAVPMHFQNNHLIISVMLDGHPIRAMIDTGASNTVLTTAAAKQAFGITADSPGAKLLRGADGNSTFGYVFQKLSFEGLEVTNPRIVIYPDKVGSKDPNNDFVIGSHIQRVDDRDVSDPVMLIGMNILSKLHLYIAFGEDKIYITPAAAPAPAPQPASAAGQ